MPVATPVEESDSLLRSEEKKKRKKNREEKEEEKYEKKGRWEELKEYWKDVKEIFTNQAFLTLTLTYTLANFGMQLVQGTLLLFFLLVRSRLPSPSSSLFSSSLHKRANSCLLSLPDSFFSLVQGNLLLWVQYVLKQENEEDGTFSISFSLLLLTVQGSGILFLFFWTWLSRRIPQLGKRNSYILAVLPGCFTGIILFFIKDEGDNGMLPNFLLSWTLLFCFHFFPSSLPLPFFLTLPSLFSSPHSTWFHEQTLV
jgi:Na+/melibiose symporter-like transporter